MSGKKGSVSGSRPMSSSDVDRPDRQRLMERRKSVDDRRSSIKSPAGEKPLSRLVSYLGISRDPP